MWDAIIHFVFVCAYAVMAFTGSTLAWGMLRVSGPAIAPYAPLGGIVMTVYVVTAALYSLTL